MGHALEALFTDESPLELLTAYELSRPTLTTLCLEEVDHVPLALLKPYQVT